MKAFWVGVCLAEIPGSDLSCQAQNARWSGADDSYNGRPVMKVDGSASAQGQTGN